MQTTSPTRARAVDYAALEAVFLTGLAGVASLARRRERATGQRAIPLAELPVMALATFTVADLLAHEKVSTWLREPFVVESATHMPLTPRGSGLRYAVGELLTCTRCAGTWGALGLVGLRTASPAVGRTAVAILALAGTNDFAQGAFRLLSERANAARVPTDGSLGPGEFEDR